jgi:methylenetetrahydrofolate reductase (NADPH)
VTRPALSFEFFPPKGPKAAFDLDQAVLDLGKLNPAFLTVTYGAGGSTKDGPFGTFNTVTHLQLLSRTPVGSHLTYFGTTKAELIAYADRLWDNNIRHIVALRGDIPSGITGADFLGDAYFQFTSDFVEALAARHPFDISVGAYPEKHPDAPTMEADLIALKKKCDAGATRAITQFFFDNDLYYRFLDLTGKAGITTPIVPGLLPISDYSRMLRFAATCKASVPDSIRGLFEKDGLTPEESLQIATDLLTHQIEDLIRHGVPHIHLYTLNRSALPLAACKAAGLDV